MDIIDSYLESLSAKGAASDEEFYKILRKNYCQHDYDLILKIMNENAFGKEKGGNSIYAIKNKSLKSAIAFNCAVDMDFYKKTLQLVLENREVFGDKILEVGCDIGIISCFLAILFPNSTIVAIDKCDSSIRLARQLADLLDVKNVDFRNVKLTNLEEKDFDTVVSIRTAHENLLYNKYSQDSRSFIQHSKEAKGFIEKYAFELFEKVKKNGYLFSLERTYKDPFLLAWLTLIIENDFEIFENCCNCINAFGPLTEAGQFSLVVAIKNNKNKSNPKRIIKNVFGVESFF